MSIRHEAVYVRRRRAALAVVLVMALMLYLLLQRVISGAGPAEATSRTTPARSGTSSTSKSTSASPSSSATSATGTTGTSSSTGSKTSSAPPSSSGTASVSTKTGPAAATAMVELKRIAGKVTPQSVVAASSGGVFVQGMSDRHAISVYLSDGTLSGTISDAVDLGKFGVKGHAGLSLGAPTSAAFSPDGATAFVTNTAMTGNGFGPAPTSSCAKPAKGAKSTNSYLYRVDAQGLSLDKLVEVGSRPTQVAVTPDGKQVLVANWCSSDLSVVSTGSFKQTSRITVGSNPSGIAVSADSGTAYVALAGSTVVERVNLRTKAVSKLATTGKAPGALLLAKDGRHLFVASQGSGTVTMVDVATGKVVRSLNVSAPRALAISSDGTALYVAGSGSYSVTKLSTSDLSILEKIGTGADAVGVAYDPSRKQVWVARKGGGVVIFDDAHLAAPAAPVATTGQ